MSARIKRFFQLYSQLFSTTKIDFLAVGDKFIAALITTLLAAGWAYGQKE